MTSIEIEQIQKPLGGRLELPGDKSLTHRAIIFGSLSEGTSVFSNLLTAEDCLCTRSAFESMGVRMEGADPACLTIHGKGLRSLKAPAKALSMGNSGTSMRLLMGVLAGQSFEAVLTGDESLCKRPMRRVGDFLTQMGAQITGKEGGNYAPLTIRGGKLKAIEARLPVASAQVKSALLLAGLYADGTTRVTEPSPSRDHTENFLKAFGVTIDQKGLTVAVTGGQKLEAQSFAIAGDISSAAFFMAAAALVKGSQIEFNSVLWNPTRSGIVEVFKQMGVSVSVSATRRQGPEPAADFTVSAPTNLKPFEILKNQLPALIDELPILMVMATQATGTSVIHDASELRVKETDRIHSMSAGLRAMGADIRVEGDTVIVHGPRALHAASVDSFKDHRTAMSLAIAGLLAQGRTHIRDTQCINTSFPSFFELLQSV